MPKPNVLKVRIENEYDCARRQRARLEARQLQVPLKSQELEIAELRGFMRGLALVNSMLAHDEEPGLFEAEHG